MKLLKDILGADLFNQVSEKLGEDYVLVDKPSHIPKERFDEINTQNKDLKAQIAERDTQLLELKEKAKGQDELTAKIAELESQNQKTVEEYEKSIKARDFDYAFENYLRDSGAKNTKAVKALFDTTTITYEDGKLKGADDQLKVIVEENSYLFNNQTKKDIGNDPSKVNGSTPITNEIEALMKL